MTYIYINVYVRYLESRVNEELIKGEVILSGGKLDKLGESFLPFHHWAINGDTRKRFSTKALWSFFSIFFSSE